MKELQFSELLKSAVNQPGQLSAAYRAFHNYSLGNQMAAFSQCFMREIPLGPIASFKAWQDKGRCVKKGEKAIALCMPVTCKGEKEKSDGSKEEFSFSRFVWRNNWFAISQTDGEEFAPEVKIAAWDKAKALEALGITQIEFDMTNGNCQGFAKAQSIAVSPIAALPHKTTFHEIAHVVLGHTAELTMTDSELTPRNIREVEAESVAYILCSILELSGQTESRGYIQHWLNGQAIPEKSAQKIYAAANKILKAGE